jgi:CTP:molybdopterin cytidylyltransferase MocA
LKLIDVFIAAGGIPGPRDPLYAEAKGGPKTMIDVAGKPMVQWVIDAVNASPSIGRIVVVGLEESSGLTSRKPLFFHPDHGSFFANVLAGINQLSSLESGADFGLEISGDIPGIRPEMVEWLAAEAASLALDVHYVVLNREVAEARFPGSGRTFIRFRDGYFCGGSAHAIALHKEIPLLPLWKRLGRARKNPFRMAVVIGPRILFSFLFRRLTVAEVISVFGRRFRITGRPLFSPYAELAMDIDKPHHLELLRRHLAGGN